MRGSATMILGVGVGQSALREQCPRRSSAANNDQQLDAPALLIKQTSNKQAQRCGI
jgi:hypothetical protein